MASVFVITFPNRGHGRVSLGYPATVREGPASATSRYSSNQSTNNRSASVHSRASDQPAAPARSRIRAGAYL
jgi:hypothetical protein